MTNETTRISKCYCGNSMASSSNPMFFESRGKDSWHAMNFCSVCHFYKEAHERADGPIWVVAAKFHTIPVHEFTPVGAAEFDHFYCGCNGLD